MIKFYAWEMKFMEKIHAARQMELVSLWMYGLYQAGMMIIWEVVPVFVGAAAFIMHTYVMGKFGVYSFVCMCVLLSASCEV